MGIQAIETQYQGCRFRSRLEARWAVFFDAMDIKWEYEKEGYALGELGWYLPDFWLPDLRVWVEVKAQQGTKEEYSKLRRVVENTDCLAGCFLTKVPSNVEELENERGQAVKSDDDEDWYSFYSDIPIDQSCVRHGLKFNEPEQAFGGVFQQVLCPVCGTDGVQIGGAKTSDSDDNTAWKGSGSAIRISMCCPNWHTWTLLFGIHKGRTYTQIEDPATASYGPLVWLGGGDVKRINKALTAARSARFEHSEAPMLHHGS